MNSRYNFIIRNLHYHHYSNSILRIEIQNKLGLNQPLYGFSKNKNNYIDTVERQHLFLIDNNFKITNNFGKIIDIENKDLKIPPNNFIWFYKNSFHLQFYNQYLRDIQGYLHSIQPSKKDYIKYILNII